MRQFFRYRNRQTQAITIARFLRKTSPEAQHPVKISKATGIPLLTILAVLDRCNDLFIRIPRAATDLRYYRLASTTADLDDQALADLIKKRARLEALWLWVLSFNILALMVLTLVIFFTQT